MDLGFLDSIVVLFVWTFPLFVVGLVFIVIIAGPVYLFRRIFRRRSISVGIVSSDTHALVWWRRPLSPYMDGVVVGCFRIVFIILGIFIIGYFIWHIATSTEIDEGLLTIMAAGIVSFVYVSLVLFLLRGIKRIIMIGRIKKE